MKVPWLSNECRGVEVFFRSVFGNVFWEALFVLIVDVVKVEKYRFEVSGSLNV